MYHDLVSNLNIPGIYALMNGKSEYHYDVVFNSIINIIILSRNIDINIKSIFTDSELALIKILKKRF